MPVQTIGAPTARFPSSIAPPSSALREYKRDGLTPSAQSIAARVEGQGKRALLLSGHAPDSMGFRPQLALLVRE